MSIAGAVHAELANKRREAWLALLIAARKNEDWNAVDQLIAKMTRELFSE